MKKVMIFLVMILVVVCFSSCAALFSSDFETVTVTSNPSGAKVKVDGMERGYTPTSISLKTNKSYIVEVSKEGYATQTANINKSVKFGWQVLDLISCPIIGNVIDFVSPRGFFLNPSELAFNLSKIE